MALKFNRASYASHVAKTDAMMPSPTVAGAEMRRAHIYIYINEYLALSIGVYRYVQYCAILCLIMYRNRIKSPHNYAKTAGFDPTHQADGPGGRAPPGPPWSTHCTAPWHLPGGFLLLEPRLPRFPEFISWNQWKNWVMILIHLI